MASRFKRGFEDDFPETHEINVTPLIDIMLVLLITFIVAAPLATVDVAVDLPASTATATERPDKPLYLTLKDDLTLTLGNETIDKARLAIKLDELTKSDKQARIFLRADKSVAYGDLMELMNELRAGGYLKIALVGIENAAAPLTQEP